MTKKTLFSFLPIFFTFLFYYCTPTFAQPVASPAPAPSPAGPPNITKILDKSGQFTTFLRLLRSTAAGDQIYHQLNDTNNGMTVFAPTDNAFSSLKSGALNSLTDQQQVELVQFHVLPTYLSMSQFQTVSNPLRTQAGSTDAGDFPLNVTSSGNQVNVSTGVDNTTVTGTVYTDGQLAVYQVDNVLLPQGIFMPKTPAPAPAPASVAAKAKRKSKGAVDEAPADDSKATSFGRMGNFKMLAIAVAVIAAFSSLHMDFI